MAEEMAPLILEEFAPVAEATVADGIGGYAGLDALAGGATMAGTGAADAGLGLAATGGAAGAGALDAGLTQLASGGTAGGALEGSSVAGGAGATGAGTVAPAATAAPAATSATLASGGGAGTPLAEGADVVASGAPQTAATATLPPTTPVETAGAGSVNSGVVAEQAPAPVETGTATGPAGVSTSTGGPVGQDYLSKGLNALQNIKPTTALTGAGLALNGYSQYKTNKAMGDMQQQIKNSVQPLTGTQSNLLNQYNSGQLNASDAATINNYVTSQTAQIKQQYASMGQGGSPQEQQAIAAVQQQAQAMQAQALQNYLTSALQTTNAITGPYATISQQQIAQDTALQGAAGNVFNAIAAQQSGQSAKP